MTTKEFYLDLGQKIQSCVIADDKHIFSTYKAHIEPCGARVEPLEVIPEA